MTTTLTWRVGCCILATWLSVQAAATAQEPPKTGPEHELLKGFAGEWEATIDAMGSKNKGSMVYKLMPGGLWLTSDFKGEMMGNPFHGHSVMGYDAAKKKYVSVWVDSWSTSPMHSEGTYDAAKKTFTEVGEGPGMDGKPVKMRMVTEIKNPDEMVFTMNMPDPSGKDAPMMTIHYKRKK